MARNPAPPTQSASMPGFATESLTDREPQKMNATDKASGMTGMQDDFGAGTGQSGSSGGAKGVVSQAGETLMNSAEQQKAAGADFISDLAGAVRRASGEFENQIPQAADYIRYAADQMDSMSDAVRRRDIGQLVSDLQMMARRQPTVFLGATFLAGFAAVRFLKSSSSGMSRSRNYGSEEFVDSGRYGNTMPEGQMRAESTVMPDRTADRPSSNRPM
jgi:hypothetical protein